MVTLISHLCSNILLDAMANGISFFLCVWADKEVKLKRTRHPPNHLSAFESNHVDVHIVCVTRYMVNVSIFDFPLCVALWDNDKLLNVRLFGAKTKSKSCARNIYFRVFHHFLCLSSHWHWFLGLLAQRLKCVNIYIVNTASVWYVYNISIYTFIGLVQKFSEGAWMYAYDYFLLSPPFPLCCYFWLHVFVYTVVGIRKYSGKKSITSPCTFCLVHKGARVYITLLLYNILATVTLLTAATKWYSSCACRIHFTSSWCRERCGNLTMYGAFH